MKNKNITRKGIGHTYIRHFGFGNYEYAHTFKIKCLYDLNNRFFGESGIAFYNSQGASVRHTDEFLFSDLWVAMVKDKDIWTSFPY